MTWSYEIGGSEMIYGSKDAIKITTYNHSVWREWGKRGPEGSVEVFMGWSINVSYVNLRKFWVTYGDVHDMVVSGYTGEGRFEMGGDKYGYEWCNIYITLPYCLP